MRSAGTVAIIALIACVANLGQFVAYPVESPSAPARAPKRHRITVADVRRMEAESRKRPRVPKLDDIESIHAEAYYNPVRADIARFEVPRERFAALLDHFRHGDIDDRASPNDRELGTLKISTCFGGTSRISWFLVEGEHSMSFTASGIRYRTTGESPHENQAMLFDALVRDIQRKVASRAGEDRPFESGSQACRPGSPDR